MRVEGYLEANRDVIRLDPDVATMQAQQGYVCCVPQSSPGVTTQANSYVAPLHCCVRVLPSQVQPLGQSIVMLCIAVGTTCL